MKGRGMPQRAWSDKRERQYDHIKEGLEERGESEDTAEEIAARDSRVVGLVVDFSRRKVERR